jgi:protein-histidine pros-kinase
MERVRGEELVEHFADALIAVDAVGRVLFWNSGAEQVFGHPRDEAIGRSLVDLVVPEALREEESRRIAAAEQDGVASFEAVRVRKDGSPVYVDVTMRAVTGPDRAVRHIAISMKDVSLLKYVREAEVVGARFGGLLDAAPDAMLLVNADGRIVLANGEAERLLGYMRDEFIGRPIEVLVPERFRAAHPSHRAGYLADPRTRSMGAGLDLAARRKDGSEFPAEISLSQVLVAEGAYTSAAVRDVSLRRRVEDTFRGLLEAAPDAIVIVDRSGRITIVNAQAERLFGYQRSEMIGQPVEMLVPRRYREAHPAHRTGYFGAPRPRSMGSGLELFAVRKDGSEIPVEISLSPLETEEGILVSSSIRDVTARKETENALRLAYKELESFSYSIAHDLRAPLRGMNGFAQILLEEHGDKLDADGLDCLNEIRTSAVRMAGLIDALLSLSRVARTEIRRERVDLGHVARSAIARLSAGDRERAVELDVANDLSVSADPSLVRNLVENLIGNAWKFTRQVADARIEIGAVEAGAGRAFFVRDNGAGFDMGHAARMFGPFQRLHTEAEFPGTGIGLATAQRIVHRHGGTIWAEGEVGKGATFFFTLPERDGRGP